MENPKLLFASMKPKGPIVSKWAVLQHAHLLFLLDPFMVSDVIEQGLLGVSGELAKPGASQFVHFLYVHQYGTFSNKVLIPCFGT